MYLKYIIISLFVAALSYFWIIYVKLGPIHMSTNTVEGKTVLITGGNTGVGKATAIEFAKLGAKVIIASRNIEKSRLAVKDIIEKSKSRHVFALQLDLSDFHSVRSFASEFDEQEEYLDFLVNNAGVVDVIGKTESGVNKIFAINHFGPFLLTNLLLDKMKKQSSTRPVRIINLSSGTYKLASLNEGIIYSYPSSAYQLFSTYASSKLANIYFTLELHKMLKDFNITTYAVNPGAVSSELGFNYSEKIKILMQWIYHPLFMKSPYYGAQTTLYCALDEDVKVFSGDYFDNCQHQELWAHALNDTVRKYLWQESLKVTRLQV